MEGGRKREGGIGREGKEGNWSLNTLTLENAKSWVCSLLKNICAF